MTEPVWIDCASVADVGPPEQFAAQASGRHHVVLRFPALGPDEKAALITRLSAALPEHAVFDSGGGLRPAWVTVLPVVPRARVLERRVTGRRDNVSDATAEVVRLQLEYDLGAIDWPRLDSSSEGDETLRAACAVLGLATVPA